MIRDRIVVGVRDDTLSNELQAKANLTLDLAKQIARQAEARAENQSIIRGETVVSAIRTSKSQSQNTKGTHSQNRSTSADQKKTYTDVVTVAESLIQSIDAQLVVLNVPSVKRKDTIRQCAGKG